ncbi:MAG: 30S ribosomal protein S18 [Candidatus Omnitrophica bacterium]|nr:30S ribosomal protein S18 [Candidatus Omnitrophota bacterium]
MAFIKKKTFKKSKLKRKKRVFRKKVCKFCVDRADLIDYKDISRLGRLLTENGKIIPRKINGNCAKHQRYLTKAIKRARQIALLPYTN